MAGQSPLVGSALTIRPLEPSDDLEAELDLRHRSFGRLDPADRDNYLAELRDQVAQGSLFGAWDGQVLVGSARLHDMRQWWRGRSLPMAGVGGVKVAPEARGRGVGRALMTELLRIMADRGYLVSALYPATEHIYRTLGWEIAGRSYRAQVPGRSLGSLLEPDEQARPPADAEDCTTGPAPRGDSGHRELGAIGVRGVPGSQSPRPAVRPAGPALRRAVPEDAGEVIAVLGGVHAASRDCGPCTRDEATVRRWLSRPDVFAYLAADGFIAYGWHGDGSREILVHTLLAGSAPTARALWGLLASHASVTEVVHVNVGPADAIDWLTRERGVSQRPRWNWMLRVVDPGSAVAGRGFPAGVQASVPIELADANLAANSGVYTLTVADSRGHLSPGLTERTTASRPGRPVRLGPRGFAALFGGTPMATLRLAGLAAGGDWAADALLDAAFAGSPYLLDYF